MKRLLVTLLLGIFVFTVTTASTGFAQVVTDSTTPQVTTTDTAKATAETVSQAGAIVAIMGMPFLVTIVSGIIVLTAIVVTDTIGDDDPAAHGHGHGHGH